MSTTMTNKLKQEINSETNYLLGRAKKALVCPLSNGELQEAWEATFEPQTLVALKHLSNDCGYDVYFHITSTAGVTIPLEGERYEVILQQNLYREPDNAKDFMSCWPLSDDKKKEFCEWVQHTGRIDSEFRNALYVVDALVGFCGTAGQLVRAMPELATFMPLTIGDMLRQQKRASGMPYEWAAFPKERVQQASLALAKAYMMPEPRPRRTYDGYDVTWAIIASKDG